MKEGGEVTRYFCIVGTNSLAVVAVAHFDPHLAGRHLAATGRPDDCSCRLQLSLVTNILRNKFQFDPRSLDKFICLSFISQGFEIRNYLDILLDYCCGFTYFVGCQTLSHDLETHLGLVNLKAVFQSN